MPLAGTVASATDVVAFPAAADVTGAPAWVAAAFGVTLDRSADAATLAPTSSEDVAPCAGRATTAAEADPDVFGLSGADTGGDTPAAGVEACACGYLF